MAEDLPGNESLETTDDLHFAFAICFAFFDIIKSRLVASHPDDHDAIQGSVSLPVSSPIEAMAVRFAARGWNRTDAAEFGESGLGTDAFGIVADEDEHLGCGPCGDPVGFEHGRCAGGGQRLEIGIMGSDFGIKRQPAPSDCP